MSREQALRAATGMVLADLLPEIAALAPVDAVRSWLTETTKTSLGEMPYLGRLAAIAVRTAAPAHDPMDRKRPQ